MKTITSIELVRVIHDVLERHNLRKEMGFIPRLVRDEAMLAGEFSVERLVKKIPSRFLKINCVSREYLNNILCKELCSVQYVLDDGGAAKQSIVVNTTYVKEGDVMTRNINLTNNGQISGNIGSDGNAEVSGEMQQMLIQQNEQNLMSWYNHSSIQEVLDLPLEHDEKVDLAGSRLAKLAKVGTEVATSFVAKMLSEMIT